MHLQEHTDDGSTEGLRELVQQAAGEPEPTIRNIVNALLKFQGIKVTASGAGAAHSHGHLSVGMDNLTECIDRVHATVSACLKRVGMEADATTGADSLSPPPPRTSSSSMLGRLGSRLLSTQSPIGKSSDGGGGTGAGGRMLEVTFGESGGGGGGGGGSGLYLSSD